ncbi:hypothetical protein FJT64_026393 [Amphibalanus amphitrite]|uniref:Uncharacterized protein n=1 Tax=Amphibalanus amphitrite TaxID=1232801 RepID=A0A6A4WC77_AMPAM|nr:hypothetical protein FJT64_026393 [Amphibalanus amphitrite]
MLSHDHEMRVRLVYIVFATCLSSPSTTRGTEPDGLFFTDQWDHRTKREDVLVPDWILAEGCRVENCAELTGREAPESYRNSSLVRISAPLLVTSPRPMRVRFPGGKEVALSSTELRNHLANALCCLVNDVTHVPDRASRLKLMTAFYETIISWLEELLIPALATEQYVSVEEREAVSRLAKDLGVLQQGRYVPAFYLDVTEAREREEERLHLQTIGLIVACAVGSLLLTVGLLFCVVLARGKKRLVAQQQGETEPLLERLPPTQTSADTPPPTQTSAGGESTPEASSLGQAVVSAARLDRDTPDPYSADSASIREITVTLDETPVTSGSGVTEPSSPR